MAIPEIFTKPEFFDVFGLPIFTFIIITSVWMLRTKKKLPRSVVWILFGVGVAGLIADGLILSGVLTTLGVA